MTTSSSKPPADMPITRWVFVGIMAAIFGLQAFAIDAMLPALEIMGDFYAIQFENDQQLVIFAFILGFGLPQLIFGPLSDRFGRKRLLQISLIGFFLTSFACMIAPNFTSLLVLRTLQGVFCAGTRVASGAVIRDLSKGRAMASILSLVYTVFMIVPILAPAIGAGILALSSWQWIFGFLGVFGLAVFLWSQIRLPETLQASDRKPLSLRQSLQAYKTVATHRITAGYMLTSGLIYSCLFAFIGTSEQVFDEVFGKGDNFHLYFAGIAGAIAVMTYSNSRVVERFGMRRISHAVTLIFLILSIINLIYMQVMGPNFWVFYILFSLTLGCFGMMGANFSSLALEYMGDIAGTANAVYGFVTMTVSTVLGFLIARAFDGTVRPLLIGFALLGFASLIVILVTERGKLFRVGEGKS